MKNAKEKISEKKMNDNDDILVRARRGKLCS